MSTVITTTIATALQSAMQQLAMAQDSPRIDAEVLLSYTLRRTRSYLHSWPEKPLTARQWRFFQRLVKRRRQGEPVAYLTGEREFWSLPIKVTRDTLIPRPETETLVECVLALVSADQALRIADLGTGSGAIALALAHECPQAQIVAIDNSVAALKITAENAAALEITSVHPHHGNWLRGYEGPAFDLIVTNPPYIRSDDPHLAQGDLPYEPHNALIAGPRGLEAIEQIIQQGRHHLQAGGWLLLEHGYDQQPAIIDLMRRHGYQLISGHRDMAGQARIVQGRQPA